MIRPRIYGGNETKYCTFRQFSSSFHLPYIAIEIFFASYLFSRTIFGVFNRSRQCIDCPYQQRCNVYLNDE